MGGNAQVKAMKKISGSLRLDLASARELEAFAQLGTELDKATQRQLDRGRRMVELLKQTQYTPFHIADQIISIYAGSKGFLDDVPVPQVRQFETALLDRMHSTAQPLWTEISQKLALDAALEKKLTDEITAFKAGFKAKA